MASKRETLLAMAKAGAQRNAEAFTRPDDEFQPILLWVDRRGAGGSPLDTSLFSSVAGKDKLAAKITRVIRNRHAYAIALILPAWHAPLSPAESLRALAGGGPDVAPSEHPRRTEILSIEVSDHLTSEVWYATVERDSTLPPRLGEWQRVGDARGRFSDAVAAGFGRRAKPSIRPQG